MDAHSHEDFSSLPDERREAVGELPSQELLSTYLEGPRKRAQYFADTLAQLFPASGRDKQRDHAEERLSRAASIELNSYENHWLKRHLEKTSQEYHDIIQSAPEAFPQESELSFHIINQYIMPQWHRLFVSPEMPKMDTVDLETAQIQIAMESAKIISSKDGFSNEALRDNELRNNDAMLLFLQFTIDSELDGYYDLIIVPHPNMGQEESDVHFLIFEPRDDHTFNITSAKRDELLEEAHAPGSTAVNLLQNLRISSISRRPAFQQKATFHKLLIARESTKTFTNEKPQGEDSLAAQTRKIGQWLIAHDEE